MDIIENMKTTKIDTNLRKFVLSNDFINLEKEFIQKIKKYNLSISAFHEMQSSNILASVITEKTLKKSWFQVERSIKSNKEQNIADACENLYSGNLWRSYFQDTETKPKIINFILIDYFSELYAEKASKIYGSETTYIQFLIKYYLIYKELFYILAKEKYGQNHNDTLFALYSADEEAAICVYEYEYETYQPNEDEIYDLFYARPISIRFHAGASQRSLIKFIKENWEEIEKLQQKYTTKASSKLKHAKHTHNEKILEREKVIASMCEKSPTEILKTLQKLNTQRDDDIFDIDIGYIEQIKHKKCKQRK